MIISKTPLRISFGGGGTDLRSFYHLSSGKVVSATINKYIYVSVHKYFNSSILLKYSKVEEAIGVEQIQHPIIKEALKLVGIEGGVEITVTADVPSGTGLASSSSFTVGLLHALWVYKGVHPSAEQLARDACKIEIGMLGEPIGKQDQYAAAYGGINHFTFNADESVIVRKLLLNNEKRQELNDNLLLYYTGVQRDAREVLLAQVNNSHCPSNYTHLLSMAILADHIGDRFSVADVECVGRALHKGWELKRGLSDKISSPYIDQIYNLAMSNGAMGGKILGAGGGGFFLFHSLVSDQPRLRRVLSFLREVSFGFESEGSRILYAVDNE